MDSQGADVTSRPVQNSKTACVILICFFNKMVFRAVWLSSSWVTRICCLFLKSVSSEYGKIWPGALLSAVLWVLTTVLQNKTKRAENWAKPGKQHNFYWQGMLSIYCIMLTKPVLITLTLIHKLQDIFTFVPGSTILCCFNPFRGNYGWMHVRNILITMLITVCYKGCVEPIYLKLCP